jgi:hypothetical protein
MFPLHFRDPAKVTFPTQTIYRNIPREVRRLTRPASSRSDAYFNKSRETALPHIVQRQPPILMDDNIQIRSQNPAVKIVKIRCKM